MARRTHKMIGANDNVRGNGVPTQSNSLSAPNLRHFVSFEDSLPSTVIADIKKGVDFADNTVDTDLLISAGGDSNSIRFGSESGSVGVTTPAWDSPAGNDWMVFSVIRAIEDPSTPGDGYACYIEVGGVTDLGVFPYMMRFEDIDGGGIARPVYTQDLDGNWSYQFNGIEDPGFPVVSPGGWWCDYCAGWNLVDGEVYSIGGIKRGDWLEHYFDGVLVGKINVAEFAAEHGFATTKWDNWTPTNSFEVSHSGYTGSGCNPLVNTHTIGHWPSEYYGFLMSIFVGGCPSQASIEAGMKWMKEDWLLPTSEKLAYPEWITL